MRPVWIAMGSIFLAMLGGFRLPLAQELDSLNTERNRGAYRVVDEIADPAERKAFLALLNRRIHPERIKLAEDFLATYPSSAFLAHVYEMGAKSHIALGNYAQALEYAEESLKLLPENPLLLVPLANVQVQTGRLGEAKDSARQALENLERFARPIHINEGAWPSLRSQLKASSYFVLGRASLTEALAAPGGAERAELMQEASENLTQARALDSENPQIAYLMGLSSLASGAKEIAARNFAAAYLKQGDLQSEALKRLREIYQSSANDPDLSFDTFVRRLAAHGPNSPRAEKPVKGTSTQELSGYAGSDACRQCHLSQHDAWSHTGMGRMLRPYQPENVIGDFEENNEFFAGDEVRMTGTSIEVTPGPERFLYARMLVDEGRHFVEINQADGKWHRYPVDYTIGSKWQQGYITVLPNGQMQVFPFQYSRLHGRWYNHWKFSDPPGSERGDVRVWEKFTDATRYRANCAFCHTSQLRNVKGGGYEPDDIEFRESGINCEMCHGPSARHVETRLEGERETKAPLDPPVEFGKISSRDYLAICGQCHMQSAVRKPGPEGELNYSRQDGLFFARYESYPLAEFTRKAFHKDGRFRITTFIVESLLRTACFKKGQINCGHCHNPHPDDAPENLTSLKFRGNPDRMCLQCHSEFGEELELHTGHPAASEASRCVSCHMPRILNSLLFRARTHKVDDVPNAEMTLRFGQKESPNACLGCHSQEDGQWLQRQMAARQENSSSR